MMPEVALALGSSVMKWYKETLLNSLSCFPGAAVACSETDVPQTRCGRVEQVAAGRVKCRVDSDLLLLVSGEPLRQELEDTVECLREPRRSSTTVRMPPAMTSH